MILIKEENEVLLYFSVLCQISVKMIGFFMSTSFLILDIGLSSRFASIKYIKRQVFLVSKYGLGHKKNITVLIFERLNKAETASLYL